MLGRDIINQMDPDELKNYLYNLQSYTKTIKEISSIRKESEDILICLLSKHEELSVLALKENKQRDQLAKLANEMEDKYLTKCTSCVWPDDNTPLF